MPTKNMHSDLSVNKLNTNTQFREEYWSSQL